MEGQAVEQKHKKQHAANGTGNRVEKQSKSKTKNHRKKAHHKSKTRSKGKKKGGLMCCRKKKKPSKKRKSKVTKKQPRSKTVKPLPPAQNEQLGDIVLVKNQAQAQKCKTPTTMKGDKSQEKIVATAKQPTTAKTPDIAKTPKTDPTMKLNMSEEKVETDKEYAKPKESKETSKEKEKEKEKPKVEVKESKKDSKKEEEEEKKDEKKDEKTEKTEKWTKMAKRIIEEDAEMAVNDFEQVACYIPPHVTKHNFVKNMSDNRFADVVCVDHSRVMLGDNTYIHANWVDVDNHKKAILTQLPLPHTAADFWQMVIEHRVKCILLILTEQEYSSLGGDFVFPQNQDFMNFEERSIRVGEFKQVEIAKGWNLKVLSVICGDYKSFLHVHHYKSWAHDSIPTNMKQIWQLQSTLRQYSSPPVYMSLSGCGRAGTFALFEVAHSSLHSDNPTFDMVKCLENVRNGRVHSVQNISQFSFVYTLIAEHILGNGFCKMLKKEGKEEENIEAILRQLTIPQ